MMKDILEHLEQVHELLTAQLEQPRVDRLELQRATRLLGESITTLEATWKSPHVPSPEHKKEAQPEHLSD